MSDRNNVRTRCGPLDTRSSIRRPAHGALMRDFYCKEMTAREPTLRPGQFSAACNGTAFCTLRPQLRERRLPSRNGRCGMPRNEIPKHIRKCVNPFRIEAGKDFRLNDFDPGETCGLDKRKAADLLQRGIKWLAEKQSLSETYALKYWWCSPPRTGIASVRPAV